MATARPSILPSPPLIPPTMIATHRTVLVVVQAPLGLFTRPTITLELGQGCRPRMTTTVMPGSSPFPLTTYLIALPSPVQDSQVWLHLPEASSLVELWDRVMLTVPTVAVVKPFLPTTHTEGASGNSISIKQEELQTCLSGQCPVSPH